MYTNDGMTKEKPFLAALLYLVLWPQMVEAHASDQAFVLLLPTQAFITGGTLAVLASVILVTVMPEQTLRRIFSPIGKAATAENAAPLLTSLASTLVFFALVFVGFNGPNDPQSNLIPLVIWTVWWVGLFVVQGMVCDLWRWINPWTGLHHILSEQSPPLVILPARLQAWPAVIIFMAFQGFVLADIAPSDPDRIALFSLCYWVFTFAGMSLFGRDAWLAQVECFTILFRLIGTLRPVHLTQGYQVGFPGWGSLHHAPLTISHAVFCLIILASGSFDGLHETFWWLGQIGINPLEFPGRSAVVWQSTIGLLVANAALIAIFAVSIWVGIACAKGCGMKKELAFGDAFRSFAVAILPIALGYHFAHYLVSFMVQIQYVLATLGDPLARGWNILGFGGIRITTGFLFTPATVKAIWLTQVFAVVFSHIVSVLMAHLLASRLADRRQDIILLQIGLSLLMIAYTFFGLWLLSAPRGA